MTTLLAQRPIRIDPARLALQPLDLDPEDFQSPLPVQHYGLVFEDEAIGLAIGIWDTTTMQEAFGPYPGDEYITVLDGGFTMVGAAGEVLASAQAGDSVTFRDGTPSSWKQAGYLRKIYLTLNDPTGRVPLPAPAATGFRVVAPDRLPHSAADPEGISREVIFVNDAQTMTVALWSYPAQELPPAPCPTHRLIRVLQGEITLTPPGSPPESFGPGAHVFLPKGSVCGLTTRAGTVAVIVDVTAD
jgi:hypothetical protein